MLYRWSLVDPCELVDKLYSRPRVYPIAYILILILFEEGLTRLSNTTVVGKVLMIRLQALQILFFFNISFIILVGSHLPTLRETGEHRGRGSSCLSFSFSFVRSLPLLLIRHRHRRRCRKFCRTCRRSWRSTSNATNVLLDLCTATAATVVRIFVRFRCSTANPLFFSSLSSHFFFTIFLALVANFKLFDLPPEMEMYRELRLRFCHHQTSFPFFPSLIKRHKRVYVKSFQKSSRVSRGFIVTTWSPSPSCPFSTVQKMFLVLFNSRPCLVRELCDRLHFRLLKNFKWQRKRWYYIRSLKSFFVCYSRR